jgi:hypothetical protein
MRKEKPINPAHLEEQIRLANGYKADLQSLQKQHRKLVLILKDIAFGSKPDARQIARKALAKLENENDLLQVRR